jgi:hypothetical protein
MTGGCLCGRTRYAVTSKPLFVNECYCRDCQKESGAGHLTFVAVPDASVAIEGAAKTFVKQADSGREVVRIFCGDCGTTLLGRPRALAGIAMIRAGTLDRSEGIRASHAVFVASAPSWDPPREGLRCVAGMPPLE